MQILFLLLILFVLPSSWPASVCKNLNGDLEKLASTYHDSMKTLSDTLMTTANVTTKINPDINKAQKVKKEISDLVKGCKDAKDADVDEDDICEKIEAVLAEIKELDADLQKMGTFDNGVVNTVRISAIEKSNSLIAVLQNSIGDNSAKKDADDDAEDDEENYKDAKDDEEEENKDKDDEENDDSDDSDTENDDQDSDQEES